MSELRKRWVVLRHPHAEIHFGHDVFLGRGFGLHMPVEGALIVGDRTEFRRGFFAEIIGGQHDELPESAFYMVGTIEDAVEKARQAEAVAA